MPRPLSILAPTRYPWRFNSPRHSRHEIDRRNFVPFNKISNALEGFTVFNPLPPRRFDLVHAFNRIPLGRTPFIIGYESHLPRAFGYETSRIFRFAVNQVASDRCRRIVAISDYARRHFLRQHEKTPEREELLQKLDMRYPNLDLPDGGDAYAPSETIRLLFVGNHFARKGGCVALRIAEIAAQRRLPIQVEIVSSLEMGAVSWTDPTRPEFFDHDRTLLKSLPTLTLHGTLPNDQTVALMKTADFLLLPTFSDTFGYSAIEAMAHHTPVIATAQGALPEFINDDQNGFLLPLDTDEIGEWRHIGRGDKGSPAYETMFREESNRLAEEALQRIERVMFTPVYTAMRGAARQTAQAHFDARAASDYWDDVYDKACLIADMRR